MALTRKHFEAIAEALGTAGAPRKTTAGYMDRDESMKRLTFSIHLFSEMLEKHNPRFDKGRFAEAAVNAWEAALEKFWLAAEDDWSADADEADEMRRIRHAREDRIKSRKGGAV